MIQSGKLQKFLIGDKIFIDNALSYEKENDARIDFLSSKSNENMLNSQNVIILPNLNNSIINNVNGTTAIPIKITVDVDDKNYKKLIEIASKLRRTQEEKRKFIELLRESVEDLESEFNIVDQSGKFKWDMTLKDFRCFRNTETIVNKGYWKFKNYQNNFKSKAPFINNTSNHFANECEVLVCKDKYIIKNENGDVIDRNFKTLDWI